MPFHSSLSRVALLFGASALALACSSTGAGNDAADDPALAQTSSQLVSAVPKTAVWNLDIENPVNLAAAADWFDIDLFDNADGAAIAAIHGHGRKVVCYFSAGSSESNRPDVSQIPAAAIGAKMDGWPEHWLDTRSAGVRTVMKKRLDLAKSIACDGVDPDNVDGYTNTTGFPLTAKTQLDYNEFLATEAHARGLVVGLKNDVDQIATLAPHFDFAVNESCFEYDECDKLQPFIAAGKSVLNVEYGSVSSKKKSVCPKANALGFFTILSEENAMNGTFTKCSTAAPAPVSPPASQDGSP